MLYFVFVRAYGSVWVCISLISACCHGWPFSLQLWQLPLRHNKRAHFLCPSVSPSISRLLPLHTTAFPFNIHQHHRCLGRFLPLWIYFLLPTSLSCSISISVYLLVVFFPPRSSGSFSALISQAPVYPPSREGAGIEMQHCTSNCCGAADIRSAHKHPHASLFV